MSLLDSSEETYPLADFQRDIGTFIEQLTETGRPVVLTVNGKAKLIVQDAESYEKMLELLDRLEAIAGVRLGLEAMKAGRGRPAREVLEEIRVMLNIPPDAQRPTIRKEH